jgi:hypothetical protein
MLTMNFIRDLFGGVVDGLVNGAANHRRAAPTNGSASDHGRIERLCRELGWPVDEREGNVIRLHFNASDGETRKVRISGGESVPADLLAYLLRRNLDDGGLGMWGIMVNDDDDVTFLNYYMALGDGLDAEALKYICESLTSEAADFDDKLRQAGLLD